MSSNKKFIVALDKSSKEQNQIFVQFCKEKKVGYWHWLSNLWLITTTSEEFSAKWLRSKLREIYPNIHLMVFEISKEGDTWAGFGPNSEDRNMFNWLKTTWNNALTDDTKGLDSSDEG